METNRVIPAGARFLSPKRAGEKCSRSLSWVWARLKSDPSFPKPIYLGSRAPVFLESDLDQWIAAQIHRAVELPKAA